MRYGYKIVRRETMLGLEAAVNEYLDSSSDCRLAGDVAFIGGYWVQVLIKEGVKPTPKGKK